MNAALITLLLTLAPGAFAEAPVDPFTAVRLAVEKEDFSKIPTGEKRSLWETRLADVDARAEDLTARIDSGALTRARKVELQAELWESFRVATRIKRLLSGPRKAVMRNLQALPGLRPLPINRPLAR